MCDSCICQAVGFTTPIRIGDQLDNGPENPEEHNKWLETKEYCGVCVATVDSYLKHIKKGDILFIFCNDPSFVFDGSVRPPINPITGKYFSGEDYFGDTYDELFDNNKELCNLCNNFADSISNSLEEASWQDIVSIYDLLRKYHNVGSKSKQIRCFIWNVLVKAFEAYDSGQFEQF